MTSFRILGSFSKIKELGSRGTSLNGESVRDFFRAKGFIRIFFGGFFLKTKRFLPKVYEIFGSEMPLDLAHEANGTVRINWQTKLGRFS